MCTKPILSLPQTTNMGSSSCKYLRLKEFFTLTLKTERFSTPRLVGFKWCRHQKTARAIGLCYNTCNQQTDYSYKVIRPFLNLSRNDITRICQHGSIPVYPDKSNQSLKYSRNRIRRQIIPSIQLFFNPLTEDALFQFAEHVSQEQHLVSTFLNTTKL